MSGRTSRNKGARAELELVHMFRDHLGIACNRNYKQVAQAQHGDIEQLIGPYLIESKNCKDLELAKWWEQARAAAEAHPNKPMPCVAYRLPNRKPEDRWRFTVPIPQAWTSGHAWGRGLSYTQTLHRDGFFLLVRENA